MSKKFVRQQSSSVFLCLHVRISRGDTGEQENLVFRIAR